MKKKQKKTKWIKSNCKGVYWNYDKLVEQLGEAGALNFVLQIQQDREHWQRMNDPFGYIGIRYDKKG